MQKRLRDYGMTIGSLETGPRNKITDVKGVTVGHSTIDDGEIKTGVTAIYPHGGNLFTEKMVGATYVLNGFGKAVGTLQVDELGTIETPILLTNTLSIGEVTNSLITYMLEHNEEIGTTTGTVNPLVAECNDMFLNNIRSQAVKKHHVYEALSGASGEFDEGAVGAGTGMKCFGLKGGIGSSSRILSYPHGTYTVGVLVLSNFGQLEHFRMPGIGLAGEKIKANLAEHRDEEDKGSVIIVVATDLPVESRQLKRIIKRAGAALGRTGSYMGNGSGDIFLGFSTANPVSHHSNDTLQKCETIHENDIDQAFTAVADAAEEAILNSMLTAKTTTGREGNTLVSLAEFMDELTGNN
ncbi:P1 family peptidase [Salipaludibacillus sp. CUR1]|uniref:DmpA family aminopeptidase n=1 Tax=Salipaludibacillus sp. CUR1 TaxID=2820003 RepID=UPI001E48D0E2|nr:P1 family peptidase [Salipaludibacillus sp. CUR1]MCE7791539.1 P1 family peptidase [Salipaludibacillus sp. CUR1]